MSTAPQPPVHPSAPQSPAPGPVSGFPAHASAVPLPPPGPGAKVPFAAPPRDRDKSRLAVGIIVGAVALLVLCGGTAAAVVGVLVWSSGELETQSNVAAEEFMDDIVDEDYKSAYRSLCEPVQEQKSREEFTEEWSQLGIVKSTITGSVPAQQDLLVRSDVELANGSQQTIELTVALGQRNMTLSVCGWETVQ